LTFLTIQELEAASERSQKLDFGRHWVEGPELLLQHTVHPFGFPLELRTNSYEVIELFEEMWKGYKKSVNAEPIQIEIRVVESDVTECPPTPSFRFLRPILTGVADKDNYLLIDLATSRGQMVVTTSALRHPLYLRFFFLELMCGNQIGTCQLTQIHAGCVSLNGRGVLLCGDSGAGKSSLSYACARAGWTYVTDDCSLLVNDGERNLVTGNCNQVRLRPAGVAIFPELDGMPLTPRATASPVIEIPTTTRNDITRSQLEEAHFIVFVNRRSGGPQELVPYRKDVARYFMRQSSFGTKGTLHKRYEVIERLLKTEVLELRYTDLEWGVDRLQRLVQEGR
jgi:hypothetical protein